MLVNLINELSQKRLDIKHNIFLNHSKKDGYYLSKKSIHIFGN